MRLFELSLVESIFYNLPKVETSLTHFLRSDISSCWIVLITYLHERITQLYVYKKSRYPNQENKLPNVKEPGKDNLLWLIIGHKDLWKSRSFNVGL